MGKGPRSLKAQQWGSGYLCKNADPADPHPTDGRKHRCKFHAEEWRRYLARRSNNRRRHGKSETRTGPYEPTERPRSLQAETKAPNNVAELFNKIAAVHHRYDSRIETASQDGNHPHALARQALTDIGNIIKQHTR